MDPLSAGATGVDALFYYHDPTPAMLDWRCEHCQRPCVDGEWRCSDCGHHYCYRKCPVINLEPRLLQRDTVPRALEPRSALDIIKR